MTQAQLRDCAIDSQVLFVHWFGLRLLELLLPSDILLILPAPSNLQRLKI